jgi:hypothetical protein
MKSVASGPEKSRLKPTSRTQRYGGKSVEFLYDWNEQLLLLTGRFVARARGSDGGEHLDLHYTGRLDPHDQPATDYIFRLSSAHLRSTVRAARPGAKADFVMEKPLLACDCITRASEFRALSGAFTA